MISVLRPPSRAWPSAWRSPRSSPSAASASTATSRTTGSTAASRRRRDAAFVKVHGTTARFYVASAALGGRRQPVDVYLPPGYATPSRPPLPGPLPPARRARPARRVPRDRPDGRRPGRARRPAPRAADDPRDAVRLDRVVHRQGMGERGRPRERLGDVPRARRRPRGRRPLPDDPRAAAARALAGPLRGRLRRAQHRHPPSGRVPRARELVRLPARRRHRRRSSAIAPRCCAGTARRRRVARAAAALRSAHTTIWFYSGTGDRVLAQNRRFAPQLDAPPAPPPLLRRPRRAQLGALARQRGARATSQPREAFVARRALGAPVLLLGLASRRRAGSTSCSPRCPGRGSATSCRSTSSRGTRRRRSSGSSSSGARPAPLLGLYARWSRLDRLTARAAARARRRALGLRRERRLDRRRATDLAARRARRRGQAADGLPRRRRRGGRRRRARDRAQPHPRARRSSSRRSSPPARC